jgi:hypothetical protein
MMKGVRIWPRGAAMIARLILAGLLFTLTLTPTAMTQPAGPAPQAAPVEPPEIGEIMMFQQLRHAKLWFAGQMNNWPLAAYEVKELREGFETVAKYYPTFNDVPLAQMIDAIRETNFAELDKAIAERDRGKFSRAFDGLTQACNACHQGNDLGFIAIRRPTAPPFSNQSFEPRR